MPGSGSVGLGWLWFGLAEPWPCLATLVDLGPGWYRFAQAKPARMSTLLPCLTLTKPGLDLYNVHLQCTIVCFNPIQFRSCFPEHQFSEVGWQNDSIDVRPLIEIARRDNDEHVGRNERKPTVAFFEGQGHMVISMVRSVT